jgi:XTP/dITP diphosphohydrolase
MPSPEGYEAGDCSVLMSSSFIVHRSSFTLVLATRNADKVTEIAALLAGLDLRLRSLADYPEIGEIEEDGRTFAENAVKKAATVALATGELALADDSGIEVEALGGRPGVLSSRYAPTPRERNERLLAELAGMAPERRGARFVCVAALADRQGHAVARTGACSGRIALEPAGEGGFGYDPIFLLPDRGLTMAQLTREEKNRISHRGEAFRAIRAVLEKVITEHGGLIPIP